MRSLHRVYLTFLLAVLGLPAVAAGQTIQATAQWNQTEPPPVAGVMTDTMKVDTLAPVAVTPTCVAAGTGSSCSASFTVTGPTALHSYVLIVCNTGFCASMSTSGQAPGIGGFKILITVQVTPGDDDEGGESEW